MRAEALRAWLSGDPLQVIGNLIEQVEEYDGPASVGGADADWLAAVTEYACVSTLIAPNPALICLPVACDSWWIDAQAQLLAWDPKPVIICDAGTAGAACNEIQRRPDLIRLMRDRAAPSLPWSATAPFVQLDSALWAATAAQVASFERSRRVARHFESKVHANRLFSQLAGGHSAVHVPWQEHPIDRSEWENAVARHRSDDCWVIVKAEFGQAGFGSTFVDPHDQRPIAQLVDEIFASDFRYLTGQAVIEEAIEKSPSHPDITFDAMALGPDDVVGVGPGLMRIAYTHYEGVTVGPESVPAEIASAVREFSIDVGRRVAEAGYVGWYCVDFVNGTSGDLSPTEINLRMTGSAFPHAVRRRLLSTRGSNLVIRTIDHHPLPRLMDQPALRSWIEHVNRSSAAHNVEAVVTIPASSNSYAPTAGLLLVGESVPDLDTVSEAL